MQFRIRRAEEAFRLLLCFHEQKIVTYSLSGESLRIIRTKADPDDRASPETAFVEAFLYFVKDLLPGWSDGCEQGADDGLTGDQCDDLLLEVARKKNIPIITFEGDAPPGSLSKKAKKMLSQIPAKAAALGVQVITPREFYAGRGLDEARVIKRFFKRFALAAPEYLRKYDCTDAAKDRLHYVGAYYERLADRDWVTTTWRYIADCAHRNGFASLSHR